MKKVWHVVERLDAEYGGPANSVPNLAFSLTSNKFYNIVVGGYKATGRNSYIYQHKLDHSLQRSLNTKLAIMPLLYFRCTLKYGKPDFVFFHNLWNLITLFGYIYCRVLRIPYAVTPRGSLFPWSLEQGKLRKKIAWHCFQKRMLELAEFLHATSDEECYVIKNLVDNTIIVSANGIEPIAIQSPTLIKELCQERLKNKRILYFGRVHQKKNIETLIRSFASSKIRLSHKLSIIGGASSDRYLDSLIKLSHSLDCSEIIEFLPFQEGKQKLNTFKTCSLLVLPSYTENFGIVALEALAAGMPVIASKGTPWKRLEEEGAGFWIDCVSSDTFLRDCLSKFAGIREDDYLRMSAQAVNLSREYEWQSCVKPLYQQLERILEE